MDIAFSSMIVTRSSRRRLMNTCKTFEDSAHSGESANRASPAQNPSRVDGALQPRTTSLQPRPRPSRSHNPVALAGQSSGAFYRNLHGRSLTCSRPPLLPSVSTFSSLLYLDPALEVRSALAGGYVSTWLIGLSGRYSARSGPGNVPFPVDRD